MDELINQITSRTGISQDQATQAVGMVVSFVKGKLPEPLASQLDGFVGSGGSAPGVAGMQDQVQQQLGNLGGMLGGNK
jgi:hypothetical protein